MSQFRSVLIGNNPMLIIASAAMAFGGTHFYFNPAGSGALAQLIGKVMLIPLHAFNFVIGMIGLDSLIGKVAIIFAVLFVSYAIIVLSLSRIFGLLAARQRARQADRQNV